MKQVQRGLGTLGFIPRSRGFEPNGIVDAITDKGIRAFQRRRNLRVDGTMHPGGETETIMNAILNSISDGQEDNTIQKEELPPPAEKKTLKIPGTNIPDRGIPEQGWPGIDKYDPFKNNQNIKTIPLLTVEVPQPNIDPGMEIPYSSRAMFFLKSRR